MDITTLEMDLFRIFNARLLITNQMIGSIVFVHIKVNPHGLQLLRINSADPYHLRLFLLHFVIGQHL